MPTKTVALSDEAYDLLREVPKGSQSAFVTEAILAVSMNDRARALTQCRMRLAEIDEGLKSCFGKSGRYNRELFWNFLEHTYHKVPQGKSLEKWLKGWLGR